MLTTEQAEHVREIQLKTRELFPTVDFPEPVMEPIYYGRFDKNPVNNRLLVMDRNTGNQFDIVSDRYDLIPHEVAVHNFLNAIPEEFGKPELKFHLWQNDARFRVEATFPEIPDFQIKTGDMVKPKVIQKNSLDRSTFYGIEFGAHELICSNGVVVYRKKSDSARRHIHGAEDIETLSSGIKEQLENFSEQIGIWSSWTEMQIGEISEAEIIMQDLPFSEKEQEKILLLPLMNNDNQTFRGLIEKGTAVVWDLHSAATQFAAHEITTLQRQFEMETKIGKTFHAVSKSMERK